MTKKSGDCEHKKNNEKKNASTNASEVCIRSTKVQLISLKKKFDLDRAAINKIKNLQNFQL